MRPFETLETATAPDGSPVVLHRRGDDLFIHLDGEELMSTRTVASEEALARLALEEVSRGPLPRVLIGGLGLGFTLRAALDLLPSAAVVVVAELLAPVVDWNRKYLADSRVALDDRRVRVRLQDVATVLASPGDLFDAVLLDIDDGPSAVCFESNLELYSREGLESIKRRLAPGGVLAVWSCQTDPFFAKRMKKAGFQVRVRTERGHSQKGARYTVFLGTNAVARSGRRRR